MAAALVVEATESGVWAEVARETGEVAAAARAVAARAVEGLVAVARAAAGAAAVALVAVAWAAVAWAAAAMGLEAMVTARAALQWPAARLPDPPKPSALQPRRSPPENWRWKWATA